MQYAFFQYCISVHLLPDGIDFVLHVLLFQSVPECDSVDCQPHLLRVGRTAVCAFDDCVHHGQLSVGGSDAAAEGRRRQKGFVVSCGGCKSVALTS